MSKINETIVMMAEQKETFEVNGKKFQIIEVTDAEQQPDYSHLVGKWLKFVSLSERGFTQDKWYLVDKVDDTDGELMFTDDDEWKNGFFKGQTKMFFDLSNPSDTNPDEKKVWEKANEEVSNYMGLKQHLEDFGMDEKQVKHIVAYALLSEFADRCNEGRVVDWTSELQNKHAVNRYKNELRAEFSCRAANFISFLHNEARDYSLKVHEQIWKDYWGIE